MTQPGIELLTFRISTLGYLFSFLFLCGTYKEYKTVYSIDKSYLYYLK